MQRSAPTHGPMPAVPEVPVETATPPTSARRRGTTILNALSLDDESSKDGRVLSGVSARRLSRFDGGGRRQSKVNEAFLEGGHSVSGRRSSRLDINASYDKGSDIDVEAQRLQKAELRVLHEEYATLQENQIRLAVKRDATAADLERTQANFNSTTKHLAQLHTLLDKNKALQSTQEAKHSMLETDFASVTVHVDTARKNERQHLHAAKLNEVRLQRTLEELDHAKKELDQERSNRGGTAVPRAEHDRAIQELQHFEKQKAELLVAFKQQMQLIDILKRQKIHLETAKLLSFIEDDFSRALQHEA
ncbi:hypothetical protein SDRG_03241 [Saprolegnia diclina VS20]|uniref:Uncharacterized protein n=1 Tax=Saprolegnia diclina (strain VS20) TaxID=1156394 RepID=T0QYP7_SAPDV|nr:hypothetical protein SDRG_03241 [Saprolegnia diclina VS20]EQC39821.1 hypothetical protein SDRG_03241 [Saprolegnia diclina VS20]|eukprot:XP_008607093.1 hypothetical protein SDRG_03241 [Saprolegnia diclina VS20]